MEQPQPQPDYHSQGSEERMSKDDNGKDLKGKSTAADTHVDSDTHETEGLNSILVDDENDDNDDDGHEKTPVLSLDDEAFLKSILDDLDDDEGSRPALPPRIKTPTISLHSEDDDGSQSKTNSQPELQPTPESAKQKGRAWTMLTEKPVEAKNAFSKRLSKISFLFRKDKRDPLAEPESSSASTSDALTVPPRVSPAEVADEEGEIHRVLEDLNLSARNNRVFSLTNESTELVRRFKVVLQDLVNGVPTAYDDLVNLLDDRDGLLNRAFTKLPKSMQRLVAQLPEKLTLSLAPEVLAAAAEAGGINAGEGMAAAGATGAAGKAGLKKLLTPSNLQKIVTKPGALASMLRAIVNALRARWPAFISTNIIWSVAVFLLLFVLWYCYKRGREVRLEQEANGGDKDSIDGSTRVEEFIEGPVIEEPESPKVPENESTNTIEAPPSPKKITDYEHNDNESGPTRRRRRTRPAE